MVPPPTGTFAVVVSASALLALLAPAAALLLALALGLEVALALALALALVADAVALGGADALLDALVPQAVIAPARPTSPTPARTPRLVASPSVCGSCVTIAPHPVCGCWCEPKAPSAHRPFSPPVRGNGKWWPAVQFTGFRGSARQVAGTRYENPLKLSWPPRRVDSGA
jgi:hypothetical protein